MTPVMIPFANGKGGVGKTALACSYAAAQAHLGADVVVADVNETQHTAVAWGAVRNHNAILPTVRVMAMNARQALESVGRYDVLIVDTPGTMDKSTLSLARKCTFMVIPTGPNPTYELAPTVKLLHALREEGIELWRLGVVLSRFSSEKEPQREEEQLARAYLAAAGYDALEGCVRNAPAYGTALAEGYGLSEIGGAGLLRDEAGKVMAAIMKGVASAERRLHRMRGPGRGKDREREGRE